MSEVIIYAASDDLIEVEGALEEEFNDVAFGDQDGAYVYVSTGDVLRFRLGDDSGEGWTAKVVVNATNPRVEPIPGNGMGDERVVLAGPVAWVVATTVEPVRAKSMDGPHALMAEPRPDRDVAYGRCRVGGHPHRDDGAGEDGAHRVVEILGAHRTPDPESHIPAADGD